MKQDTTSKFIKVSDRRGKPIEGLWLRNQNYYAQLRLMDPATGKTKLTKKRLRADNPTEAKKALTELLHQRDNGTAPPSTIPVLRDYMLSWLEGYRQRKLKTPRSFSSRQSGVRAWLPVLGGYKLDAITPQIIRDVCTDWSKASVKPNTIRSRLDVLAIVMKKALGDRIISFNPMPHVERPSKENKKRKLFTTEEVNVFAEALGKLQVFGADPKDYCLLIAYTGARRNEVLGLTWERVDWEARQVNIYGSKTDKERYVEFHPKLEALLRDMHNRRPPSAYLFPSYHDNGAHACEPPESWKTARESTGLQIHPHDLRVHFISYAVMSGCDWLTIAQWSGHTDANMLAKVYAHLRPDYRRQQAGKLNFEPVIFEATQEAA